jgi:murein DD-endopeptidase
MSMVDRRSALLGIGSAVATCLWTKASSARTRESFDIAIPLLPTAYLSGGLHQCVYEIHLTNFSLQPLRARTLRILDAGSNRLLAEFSGQSLAERFVKIASAGREDSESTVVRPGLRGVIFVELSASSPVRQLAHRLEYSDTDKDETSALEWICAVDDAAPIVLGAPLHGGPWAAVYDPAWKRGHRRVFYTVDGRAHLPGRHAIDWVKVDAQGRIADGPADITRNHLGYAADVLAVGDGKVVDIRTDMAESATVSGNERHALGDGSGNYVMLELGPRRFALYEHLQPGSVRVRSGESVKRGQLIASLGFTGDSTGPHLHFHVADAPTTLGAEGLPFVFERFELLGQYFEIGRLGTARWNDRSGDLKAERRGERPGPNAVIGFDS